MRKTDVKEFFKILQRANPNPETELLYTTPYTLLVAVVLSAQATDLSVNKATKRLFSLVDNPENMIKLGEYRLRNHIKSIGLFNSKARNIIKLSKILISDYNSNIPNTREALERLPGVGRKTANVVLNMAFAQPTIAVDTHVFRLSNRTGLAAGKTPLDVELKLDKAIPNNFKNRAHLWLILHGRYICLARKPKCPDCIIHNYCAFKEKTTY